MIVSRFTLSLPEWAIAAEAALPPRFPTLEEQMQTVIRFSRLNMERETGGPFAAGVFARQTGRLIAIGVNRVVPHNCSSAHAEVMALSLAQQRLETFDLGGPGLVDHQLVVNWRPCAMCYGATIWSGVRRLVIAGSGPELEELTGFDEGPVPADWRGELERRGIAVVDGVLREKALAVFAAFRDRNALVYNGRRGEDDG